MDNLETYLLNNVLLEELLAKLTEEELDIILLWAHKYTYKEISLFLKMKYGKPEDVPLYPSAVGVKIRKILEKLKRSLNGN